MPNATQLIETAFDRLAERSGFQRRESQVQLALLLGDLIEGGRSGAFEAPTGLGKSLATLIPAIAHAKASGKRTIVATYTNILAEQYWRQDLPLALSLFDDADDVSSAFLIGRQRYACLAAAREVDRRLPLDLSELELGIETEFRAAGIRPGRLGTQVWQQIAAPPVCPGRLCGDYPSCFYYRARREAEKAQVVITNHSVVVQDALMANADQERVSMLGKFDFLVLDEAHDFPQAAQNGLEFELSGPRLSAAAGLVTRMERALAEVAESMGDVLLWAQLCESFRQRLAALQRELAGFGATVGRSGILTVSPADVGEHAQVSANTLRQAKEGARQIAAALSEAVFDFLKAVADLVAYWKSEQPERTRSAAESIANYQMWLRELGAGGVSLFDPGGVSVSYVGQNRTEPILRHDVIGLAEPLRELVWSRTPYACLSATLALDGTFDFFCRTTGAEPEFEEILPSPFDFASQAALYLPPDGAVPDPTAARRDGTEDFYHAAVARHLTEILEACDGRTLALFHSRREMEEVYARMSLPPDLPILMQAKSGMGALGERFRGSVRTSLFALRSFWTGFDAPGETLSCVVLVRVPFEVPVEPPQIMRLAWMQTQGLDAFGGHTLALAKMMMRQGAGRLIRRSGDKGVIALLDPRLLTKRYGEDILANLPQDMRRFRDIADAVGWIGLEPVGVPR